MIVWVRNLRRLEAIALVSSNSKRLLAGSTAGDGRQWLGLGCAMNRLLGICWTKLPMAK